ncbi:homoserine kinase [Arthrobacter sp. I2-34]|uniref:Homoserine kinase n=1 Tax=Arthrobacter hankyongi TaxID=2904801 RepID=A0ABS9LBZ4_9MICC|nr:homoserine kinase [Arthrobacter hankyongi]MCG2623984.1 homoserine kinase [Arthrobacter hankyongi]
MRILERTVVKSGQRVSVRVPATSANLGPGFDSLGLALGLHDSVTLETTDDGIFRANVTGEGASTLPTDETHLIIRTVRETLEAAGFSAAGLRLRAENVIPHGRGLGSSAAAIVSAVLAANALLPAEAQLGAAQILQRCSELEGHPDNVAPALAGRLAISWEDDGAYRSTAVDIDPHIVPVVAIPAYELSTELARDLLPGAVPHAAAAANSGRAALLVQALTRDPALLLPGTVDALHQAHRAPAMRPSADLIHALRAAGHAAVVSGAGPTVMTLAANQDQAAAVEALIAEHLKYSELPDGWRVLRLAVDMEGAKVSMHPRN